MTAPPLTEKSIVAALNLLAFAVVSGQHYLTPAERAAIADLNAAAAQADRRYPAPVTPQPNDEPDCTWEPLPTA